MKLRNGYRNPAERLRKAVYAMPRQSRVAMLEGIERNRIIAGAYADPGSGGVCPMLAAHRNGGRTDLGIFARSWDSFTGASKPRRATKREVAALRGYLEHSLVDRDEDHLVVSESISAAAMRIRAERSQHRRDAVIADTVEASRERGPLPTGERDRSSELRGKHRWSWMRPTRRLDTYRDRVAAASEQIAEQRATDVLSNESAGDSPRPRERAR